MALKGGLTPLDMCIQNLKLLQTSGFVSGKGVKQIDQIVKVLGSSNLLGVQTVTLADEDSEDHELQEYLQHNFTKKERTLARKNTMKKLPGTETKVLLAQRSLRLVSSPEVTDMIAKGLNHWSFDTFMLRTVSEGNELLAISLSVFDRSGIKSALGLDEAKLRNFIWRIQQGHEQNPFHNALRTADNMHCLNFLLFGPGKLNTLFEFDDVELFALMIACIVHTFEHPGVNNHFLTSARLPIATLHNDLSPLQRQACSAAFRVMQQGPCDILGDAVLSETSMQEFKSLVVSLVLGSDSSHHYDLLNELRSKVSGEAGSAAKFVVNSSKDRQLLLTAILRYCDISSGLKPQDLAFKWSALVTEENFRQGDLEKAHEMSVSPMFDRESTVIPKSLKGYLKYLVKPFHELFSSAILGAEAANEITTCLDKNFEFWRSLAEDEKQSKWAFPANTVQCSPALPPERKMKYLFGLDLIKKGMHLYDSWTCVHVNIQEGKHLAIKNRSGLSDPYVKLSLDMESKHADFETVKVLEQTLKSSIKAATVNPDWDEDFSFFVPTNLLPDMFLSVQVWNANKIADEAIGEVSVALGVLASSDEASASSTKAGTCLQGWHHLTDKKKKANHSGAVFFTVVADSISDFQDSIQSLLDPLRRSPVSFSPENLEIRRNLLKEAVLKYTDQHISKRVDHVKISVFVGTWNIGEAPPPDDQTLSMWLLPGQHIYAIGTQENTYANWTTGLAKMFKTPLYEKAYGEGYSKVCSVTISYFKGKTKIETKLAIFALDSLHPYISHVQPAYKATGKGGVIANKGGVMISFRVRDLHLAFVSSHLAAHQHKIEARNSNVRDIIEGTRHNVLGSSHKAALDSGIFDHVFWCGDLNYRIDYLNQQVGMEPSPELLAAVQSQVEKEDYSELFQYDQLSREMSSSRVFSGFQEAPIAFPPTFKYKVGTSEYSGKRLPAWCDRILWKSKKSLQVGVLNYTHHPELCTSDHKPVSGLFEIDQLEMPPAISPTHGSAFLVMKRLNATGLVVSASTPTIFCTLYAEFFTRPFKSSVKTGHSPAWEEADLATVPLRTNNPARLKYGDLCLSFFESRKMSAERIGSAVLHFDSANDGSVTNFNAKLTIGGHFKGNISGSLKIVWSDGSQSQHAKPDARPQSLRSPLYSTSTFNLLDLEESTSANLHEPEDWVDVGTSTLEPNASNEVNNDDDEEHDDDDNHEKHQNHQGDLSEEKSD
eukprot:CAMPEP_0175124688 /NCGR_PEP_ID=MMETSP0087-20121206/2915_1 /TAXON_ID=136419 /ORGANISM="Unknown Unknown, Strain D1" /LENGTH=1223 /DNA_ID=CAMNT_0016406473 /DNA_START=13 /DNA_END=3684 /DNA_ORIENTATION=-